MQDALYDKVFSVTEITQILSSTLEEMFYGLRVEGEVCNFRSTGAKHWYFSIKDRKGSMLNCTCFASMNWRLKAPQNGTVVVVTGSMSFWQKGGSLSFNCSDIKAKGEGDLRAEIEKRRAYYKNLGWFEEEWKKPLPDEINTIGIITADTGAVIHDIMRVSRRRAPGVDLILLPSPVQGEGAERVIAKRIRQANNFLVADVLIVGRGGGSEEDLAPYSSVEVIEAIHDSVIPVISAVGHDSDFPLSDFVADVRASTPSAAAEIATQKKMETGSRLKSATDALNAAMRKRLYDASLRLSRATIERSAIERKIVEARSVINSAKDSERIIKRRIEDAEMEIDRAEETITRLLREKGEKEKLMLRDKERSIALSMERKIRDEKEHIDSLIRTLSHETLMKVSKARSRVSVLTAEVRALSPMDVLKRGYSIVTDDEGKVINASRSAKDGMHINIKVRQGSFGARVEKEEK